MGHKFKKQYGQNFLRNDRFVHELLAAGQIQAGDTVIEIGPGDGRVTNQLLNAGAKVIAIEVDYALVVKLIQRFGENKEFELIHQDVLTIVISELQSKYNFDKYKVVGSLPYNISKHIIRMLMEGKPKPELMAFIVQEEVAQDYVALPPRASSLSNWIRTYANVRKFLSIPKNQFFPEPKVNGAILQIVPLKELPVNHEITAQLIRVGFTTPRKTLLNNLRTIKDWQTYGWENWWTELGLTPTSRAAELTLSQWSQLAQLIYDKR